MRRLDLERRCVETVANWATAGQPALAPRNPCKAEEMEGILARHSGRTPEQVAKDIERDKILTAADAKDYGLIDAVISSRKVA